MTISRIAKTIQGRFSLFDENGDFLFSIDGETMVKNHVREGAALDAASLEALKEQSDTRKAKDKALGYLSLRDHASGELYDKLCRKFDARSAAAAVAEMQRLGLINDENFARHRAKYLADQNRSPREIRRRLRRALTGMPLTRRWPSLPPTRRRPAARSLRKTMGAGCARADVIRSLPRWRAGGSATAPSGRRWSSAVKRRTRTEAGNDPSRPGGNARALLSAVHF